MRILPHQDATGRAMLDYLDGHPVQELVERDDGMIAPSGGPAVYFSAPQDWATCIHEALGQVRGRVLDVGCGAGRISLVLQERGHEVLAIDNSPGAVKVARRRGVQDVREMAITQVGRDLGIFDTIVMFGNNFGLFAGARRAQWLLRRFHARTSEAGRILAESRNPYRTDEKDHLDYHRRNRMRGRMSGQVRVRTRYGRLRSPWFDYLLVSPEEMEDLLDGTGWQLQQIFPGEDKAQYVAMITKVGGES